MGGCCGDGSTSDQETTVGLICILRPTSIKCFPNSQCLLYHWQQTHLIGWECIYLDRKTGWYPASDQYVRTNPNQPRGVPLHEQPAAVILKPMSEDTKLLADMAKDEKHTEQAIVDLLDDDTRSFSLVVVKDGKPFPKVEHVFNNSVASDGTTPSDTQTMLAYHMASVADLLDTDIKEVAAYAASQAHENQPVTAAYEERK